MLKRQGASRGRQAVSELVLLKEEKPLFWLQWTSAWCLSEVTVLSDSSFSCLMLPSPVNVLEHICNLFTVK